jgi:DNA uptake protein ComE-like DNA-binding protein
VKFTENLLEITDARLAQFIKGFDAEIAARPAADRQFQQETAAYESATRLHEARLAEYDRAQKEWEKRNAAYEVCVDGIGKKHEKESQKDMAAGQQVADRVAGELSESKEKRLQAMADRMKAAQARGDQVAVRAIADSVMREMQGVLGAAQQGNAIGQRMTARSAEMEAEVKTKCGAVGEAPKRPDMPNSADPEKARQATEAAAAKASGLTAAQYGLMKERIETYVRFKGRTGSTQYIFTAAELEALSKQLAELQKRPDLVEPSYWYPGKKS